MVLITLTIINKINGKNSWLVFRAPIIITPLPSFRPPKDRLLSIKIPFAVLIPTHDISNICDVVIRDY